MTVHAATRAARRQGAPEGIALVYNGGTVVEPSHSP